MDVELIGANGGHPLRRDEISAEDEGRFWRMVEKTNGCWYWRAADVGEYGHFRLRDARRTVKAHKASAALAYGDIPRSAVILHRCDEPSCVRPDHLSIGTQRENVRDCINKGRHRKRSRAA